MKHQIAIYHRRAVQPEIQIRSGSPVSNGYEKSQPARRMPDFIKSGNIEP
jgi:hypothetical protein